MWVLAVTVGRLGVRVWDFCCQRKREQECFGDVNRGLKLLEDVWRTIRGLGRD